MPTFRLRVEYDGTAYCGWQRQDNGPTVQATLEKALERALHEPVRCHAAGRTDAGVHALGQVVRIDISRENMDARAVLKATNTRLPPDLRIAEAAACPPGFDPRRDAVNRCYRYTVFQRTVPPVLERNRVAHWPYDTDWQRVDRAISAFVGRHEFEAFRSSACEAPRSVLTMTRAEHIDRHPLHHFEFECRSFLQHQVRLMCGLLLEIGRGRFEEDAVAVQLAAARRTLDFPAAPPRGLVLVRVDYDEPRS